MALLPHQRFYLLMNPANKSQRINPALFSPGSQVRLCMHGVAAASEILDFLMDLVT